MSCCDETEPVCPCGVFVHPTVITNPPGLSRVTARSGDYLSFRHALLQALPGETELSRTDDNITTLLWRPSAQGDLALQLIEWWAYLAEILTFYNERIVNESYLRTAILPESVNRLIRQIGYRPRPALGAKGTLAALVNRVRPVVLPQGMQVQNKPGPGQLPQIFEVDAATAVSQPDTLAALPAATPPTSFFTSSSGAGTPAAPGATATLLVAGRLGTVRTGDELLLAAAGWDGSTSNYALGNVSALTDQPAPGGAHNTQVQFAVTSHAAASLSPTRAANWRLLATNGTARLYPYLNDPNTAYGAGPSSGTAVVHLASVFRQINPGDFVVIDDPRVPPGNSPLAGIVTACTEAIYFANNPGDPGHAPPNDAQGHPVLAVPVLHSVVTFATPSPIAGDAASLVLRFGWQDIGRLIDPPATAVPATSNTTITVTPPATDVAPSASGETGNAAGTPVLVEDANGDGAFGAIDANGNLTLTQPAPTLTPPLTTLLNLVRVSRGKSVTGEVLGSGDGNVLNQDFTLRNAPVTYFADGMGRSGPNFSSTVRVWVNGVEWQEVPGFFGRPANAQVFRTREDDAGNTHVVFGDGACGARLPTGANNVLANYRYGGGAAVPDVATLVSVLQAQPGLASLVNPVAPNGGADADPPERIRTLAPQSVLTFERAVSLDDYQTLAANAPGVSAAQAAYVFDPLAQRPSVHVWVAGDGGAAAAARTAIAARADPNRACKVEPASAIDVWLKLTYVRDPRYLDADVRQGLHDALLDPDRGLFGSRSVRIGEACFDSDIYAACLAVPGVTAVHGLSFDTQSLTLLHLPIGRLTAGELNGAAIRPRLAGTARKQPLKLVARAPLPLRPGIGAPVAAPAPCQLERYTPGDGSYFALPDDGAHLTLTAEMSS